MRGFNFVPIRFDAMFIFLSGNRPLGAFTILDSCMYIVLCCIVYSFVFYCDASFVENLISRCLPLNHDWFVKIPLSSAEALLNIP